MLLNLPFRCLLRKKHRQTIRSSIHLPVNLGNSHRSCPQFGYRFLHWCSQTMYCLWRGQTLLMRSDNGGNFVKAKRELWEAVCDWNQSKIHDFLLARNIKWIFNPPAWSYHGGVWEWCIRSVWKVMKTLTKEEPLVDEGLLTLICEVEVIINSWSTTKVSDDPSDPEALTPNHLLLLRSGPTLPSGWFSKEDNYPSCRWKQVQHLADVYWRCWIREYLPTLQERRKWANAQRNFSVNNIVLVLDERVPLRSWLLGRVLEV